MQDRSDNKPFLVLLTEYERDWGNRPDELLGFDTAEEADAYVTEFNKSNNAPVVPEWYMKAARVTAEYDNGVRILREIRR